MTPRTEPQPTSSEKLEGGGVTTDPCRSCGDPPHLGRICGRWHDPLQDYCGCVDGAPVSTPDPTEDESAGEPQPTSSKGRVGPDQPTRDDRTNAKLPPSAPDAVVHWMRANDLVAVTRRAYDDIRWKAATPPAVPPTLDVERLAQAINAAIYQGALPMISLKSAESIASEYAALSQPFPSTAGGPDPE